MFSKAFALGFAKFLVDSKSFFLKQTLGFAMSWSVSTSDQPGSRQKGRGGMLGAPTGLSGSLE